MATKLRRTDDARVRSLTGVGLAILSAGSFGMAGAWASGLLDSGWSAGAVTFARVGLAAVILLPFGVVMTFGQWSALRRNIRLIVTYGLTAVAGAQYCMIAAVSHMDVATALLIQQTAPVAVVVWLWWRHGHRPSRALIAGSSLAAVGLVLVLDLGPGSVMDGTGVAWAFASMLGAAAYFVLSADESNGLPALVMAVGGLVTGAVVLSLLGLVGLLPMTASRAEPTFQHHSVHVAIPLLVLGLVTAAVAYVTGIVASRCLGSRLAAFLALLEVPAGGAFAWLLLGEVPRALQLAGGLLILGGVLVVRLEETSGRLVVPDTGSQRSVALDPRLPR